MRAGSRHPAITKPWHASSEPGRQRAVSVLPSRARAHSLVSPKASPTDARKESVARCPCALNGIWITAREPNLGDIPLVGATNDDFRQRIMCWRPRRFRALTGTERQPGKRYSNLKEFVQDTTKPDMAKPDMAKPVRRKS